MRIDDNGIFRNDSDDFEDFEVGRAATRFGDFITGAIIAYLIITLLR